MPDLIQGIELCEGFFHTCAKPILDRYFPGLRYSAGLIGYGSDVLGYDDAVSRDHMWGPRFYLFLDGTDIGKHDDIFRAFSENLPYTYRGYSVNFSEPDPDDCNVQHPQLIDSGRVNPLIFIRTFPSFLAGEIGTADPDHMTPLDWLACSEHRLLSLVSGKLFADQLNLEELRKKLRFYPPEVKLYLIVSQWDIIASEQAFVRRCGDVGDEVGSQIICARIAERLMRLCFLYRDTYAPYSKWFGTAFQRLELDGRIKVAIAAAVQAKDLTERENRLVEAQALVAGLHNASGLTEKVDCRIGPYFERNIKVIWANRFADAAKRELKGTALEGMPLIGTMSQMGGLSGLSDRSSCYGQIKKLYGVLP